MHLVEFQINLFIGKYLFNVSIIDSVHIQTIVYSQ